MSNQASLKKAEKQLRAIVEGATSEQFDDSIHFLHLHNPESGGVLTFAYQLDSKHDGERKVQYATAACCPADNFCKVTGRIIALRRLYRRLTAKAGGCSSVVFTDSKKSGLYSQAAYALRAQVYNGAERPFWWIDETEDLPL